MWFCIIYITTNSSCNFTNFMCTLIFYLIFVVACSFATWLSDWQKNLRIIYTTGAPGTSLCPLFLWKRLNLSHDFCFLVPVDFPLTLSFLLKESVCVLLLYGKLRKLYILMLFCDKNTTKYFSKTSRILKNPFF